jgi:hypothetical protein
VILLQFLYQIFIFQNVDVDIMLCFLELAPHCLFKLVDAFRIIFVRSIQSLVLAHCEKLLANRWLFRGY